MKKLIVIADWADDSLNRQEFLSAVSGFLQDGLNPNINFVSSTPSTIHTAFLTQQIVTTEERFGQPQATVIFLNTDPRIQTSQSVELSKGADFIVAKLVSGIYLCGPNAGYCFSMIKNKIDEVYLYPGLDKGSQFRSRDLYSRVSAHLMDGLEDEMELEETASNIIPEIRENFVCHIDNHGNIKTNILLEDFKGKFRFGDSVNIKINNETKEAKFVTNLFGSTPGELVIYPGSSGSKDNPYLEISVWSHFTDKKNQTGKYIFNNPVPGQKIEVK